MRELESKFAQPEAVLRDYEESYGPISAEERRAFDEGHPIGNRSLLIYVAQHIMQEAELHGNEYRLLNVI